MVEVVVEPCYFRSSSWEVEVEVEEVHHLAVAVEVVSMYYYYSHYFVDFVDFLHWNYLLLWMGDLRSSWVSILAVPTCSPTSEYPFPHDSTFVHMSWRTDWEIVSWRWQRCSPCRGCSGTRWGSCPRDDVFGACDAGYARRRTRRTWSLFCYFVVFSVCWWMRIWLEGSGKWKSGERTGGEKWWRKVSEKSEHKEQRVKMLRRDVPECKFEMHVFCVAGHGWHGWLGWPRFHSNRTSLQQRDF